MKKRYRPHATDRQREMIRKLTVAGVPQKQIARRVGLTRFSVWKNQKRLGLRQFVAERVPLSETTKRKIISMLRQNLGRLRIARELGVSLEKIDKITRRIKFRRRRGSVGCRYKLTGPEIARIRQALTESEQVLCKRFHISRWWLRRFRVGSFSRKRKRNTTRPGRLRS
jgi:hypothetical protein